MKLQKSPKQLLKFSPKAGKIARKVAETAEISKTAPKIQPKKPEKLREKVAEITINHKTAQKN